MSDDNFTFQRCRANDTVDKREKMSKYEKKKKIDIKSSFHSPKHAISFFPVRYTKYFLFVFMFIQDVSNYAIFGF